jgi:hypothetical protein
MHRTLCLGVSLWTGLLLAGSGHTQPTEPAKAAATFPASWVGHWKGEATTGVDGRMQKFSMELVIAPTEAADRYRWTIIYDGAAGRQERPYVLVVKDAAKGLYAIDEANGIVLDARLIDGALYSHFLVQGNRITTRERLETDDTGPRIDVEMVTTVEAQGTDTGNAEGGPAVRTWTPVSVQKAALRKQAE